MQNASGSWLFFPDFTAGSPYQDHLAAALAPHGWMVRAGDIAAALQAGRDGPAVFHIGWEQPVYQGAATETAALARIDDFLHALDAFRRADGTVVWSIHNQRPHEERFPAVNDFMQQALAKRADIVHVHNREGGVHAASLGVPSASIVLSRHPSYSACYPDDVTDAAGRAYLDLEPDAIVFAFFGAMRGYKGLSRLMRAFDVVSAGLPAARLVIAGRSGQPTAIRMLTPDPRLRILPRDIADAEIQYVMHAADCVVLPYEAILTSGVVALAQGFGRPVIVPDLPSMVEEVLDGVDGFLFEAGNDEALQDVLRRAAAALPRVRGRMRVAARAAIAGRTFPGLAAALANAARTRLPLRRAA